MRAPWPVTQVTQLPTSLTYMKIRSDLGPCVRSMSFCHLRHSVARGPVKMRLQAVLRDCARQQRVRPAYIQAVACGCPRKLVGRASPYLETCAFEARSYSGNSGS